MSADPGIDTDVYRAAVLRELGVLGEAAAHLSDRYHRDPPEVPWGQIVGLRDLLVHGCWDTAWWIIEQVISADVPQLRAAISDSVDERPFGDDIGRLVAEAAARMPLSGTPPDRRRRDGRECGEWMPIAHCRCVRRPGHPGHDRSR